MVQVLNALFENLLLLEDVSVFFGDDVIEGIWIIEGKQIPSFLINEKYISQIRYKLNHIIYHINYLN